MGEDGAKILIGTIVSLLLQKGKFWVNNYAHVLQSNDNIDINFIAEKLESLDYSIYNTGNHYAEIKPRGVEIFHYGCHLQRKQVKIGTLLSLLNERITTQSKIIEKMNL